MPDPLRFRSDLEIIGDSGKVGYTRAVTVVDPVSNKFFHLSQYDFRLLNSLDGNVDVRQAVERLRRQGFYYDAAEAARTVQQAAAMGLLIGARTGTAEFQKSVKAKVEAAKKAQYLSKIYFAYIPLWNPDRFLEQTLWVYRKLANKWTALLWLALSPGALYFIVSGMGRLEQQYLYFFNVEGVLYLWLTILLTKTLHELAHAYAAKGFGLRVPEMGVALLIFFPCLYCNTSDAWRLADRRQRLAITAAGMIAEGVVAIAATYIWYFTKPGLVNSLAYYLVVVSFVSTVLFNGNPLMKFDGYFLLSDYLQIPNLSAKSMAFVKYLFLNRVLGVATARNPASTPREGAIFVAYGISAFVYRVFLFGAIAIGIYFRFDKLIGAVLCCIYVLQILVGPLRRSITSLYASRKLIHPRKNGVLVFALLIAVAALLLATPISFKSVFPCYLAPSAAQKIAVPLRTPVGKVFARKGMLLDAGAPLFLMDSRPLELELARKKIDQGIVNQQIQLLLLDSSEIGKCEEKVVELAQVEHEIKMIEEDLRKAQSGVAAPFSGWVTALDWRVQDGFTPGEGAVVGDFASNVDCEARALVGENDVHMAHPGQEIEIWLPAAGDKTFTARIQVVKPYAEVDMKDSPFSSRVGGEIAVEQGDHGNTDAPLTPQYVCIASFPNPRQIPLFVSGKCALSSPPQSILSRMFQAVVQTFNRETMF
jgi:putative peptide zinc metalloprotease protein